jgi:hypothetical protein
VSSQHEGYEVGYGKPPRRTRFQPGTSGNPGGRPRGSKNSATLLAEALKERVAITENGRRKKISKHKAVFKQLVNKAAGGDHRAADLLLKVMRLIEQNPDSSAANQRPLDEADQQVMLEIVDRFSSSSRTVGGGGDE